MKKKIVFMVINMNVGGTEKALLNMIAEIPKEEYEITILMLEKRGGFLNSIPSSVHVEVVEEYENLKKILNIPIKKTVLELFKSGGILKSLQLSFFYSLSKLLKDKRIFLRHLLCNVANVKNEYDIAVAYAGPMDFISYFVIHKIKAKKKVQWIHFDITKIGFNSIFASKLYKQFDQIFVVSNDGKKKLIHALPILKEKVDHFYNLLSPELVVQMADEASSFKDDFTGFRIVTVGRLSKEKGQDLSIRILAKLKKDGYNVRWYCIGEGSARAEYEQLIKQYQLEEDFILLGSRSNPYPFIKECDVYVQSSRHEGYCITLAEAICLNVPIVSTNFTGASEQIIHKQTGLLVNVDEQEMYLGVKQLLDHKQLRDTFKNNLKNKIKDTTNDIEKFYKLAQDI